MPQLHETMAGKKLFQGHIPAIVKALNRIADALEEISSQNSKEAMNSREEREG